MSTEAARTRLAYRQCQSLTRSAAGNFYYGIRLLPAPKRRAMCAVYAYARRVDDIGDGTLPAAEKLRRLDALAAGLHEFSYADPDPVMVALADARERFALPLEALEALIEGVRMDVLCTSYEDFAALELYCRRVAGSIVRLCLAIFGTRPPAPPEDGAPTHGAAQLADELGCGDAAGEHRARPARGRRLRTGLPARQGSRALPSARRGSPRRGRTRQALTREGASAELSVVAGFGGGDVGQLYALMRFQCLRARDRFHRGLELVALLDRRSAACVMAMTGIYLACCCTASRSTPTPRWPRASPSRPARRRASPRARCSAGASPSAIPPNVSWRPNEVPAGALRRDRPVSARVAVIGGGLAGITAALDCAQAGAQVTLVEVRPQLGGAAYSFERAGLRMDNGQHVFLRCCAAYRALLRRIGGAAGVHVQSRLEIPVLSPGRPPSLLRRSSLPAPLHLAGALARYPHLRPLQRLRAARAALALGRLDPHAPLLDERTLGQWLAAHRQGPRELAALWDLIALPTLNLPAAQASLALGAFVFRKGLLERADAGDIGFHRSCLSEIVGEPAERSLRAAGVQLRLGWRARELRRAAAGFELSGGAEGEGLQAEAVIVALPHTRAAKLIELLDPRSGGARGDAARRSDRQPARGLRSERVRPALRRRSPKPGPVPLRSQRRRWGGGGASIPRRLPLRRRSRDGGQRR